MLSSAAIPTYLVVLFLIPGTFSQNELFYRSETYCRRFVPPMITSALGLCTYPCLLLSNDQPPKILVISEPDGTVCKIYNGFLQTPQAGECRAGFCQETQDYGIKKRMKRDVSTPVSSSQRNSSASQKQLSSRRGSEKPKMSRRERIELRRRQMWAGCDCANMRGLFIDMSFPRSALSIGRSGRRGRRRKVGCRVICIFLINRYKHDPKWASLFEAAIGNSPGGNRGDNISRNETGTATSRISAVGPNSGSRFVGVNGSGSIGSVGTGLTSNQPSGPPAAGAHNGDSVINAGGGSGGGSTSENTGSKNVGSASTSINGGTSAIASTTSGVMTIGVSSGGNVQNSSSRNGPVVSAQTPATAGGGISAGGLRVSGNESGSSGTSSGAAIGPGVGTRPTNVAVSSMGLSTLPSQITATSSGIKGASAAEGASEKLDKVAAKAEKADGGALNTISGNGAGRLPGNINGKPLQNTGISGVTAPSSNPTSASSSERGTHSPDIGSVGSGLSEGVATGSLRKNDSDINISGSLKNGSNGPPKPKVENAAGASTMISGGTGSGSSIRAGNQTVSNGVLGASTGGLPRQPSAGSPTSAVAGGPENGSVLSTATSSSVSGVGTSSLGSATNINITPVGNQTDGNGALGASTGGLPKPPSAGSPTGTVAGGPENGRGLSTATSSSVSGVGTSSFGSGTNINTSNTPTVEVTSSTHTTGTRGNPGITGTGTNASSSSGMPGVTASVYGGGGSSSGEGAAIGVSTNVGVVSGTARESSASTAHPSDEGIRPSLSSGGAGAGTAPEATRISVTGGGLSGASTASTTINTAVTAGGGLVSAGISGTGHTGNEGAEGTSSRGTTGIISTGQPSFPGAASAGSAIGMGTSLGTGFGRTPGYGAGPISGSNIPVNFGGAYGSGANGFGSTVSGPWSPAGGAYSGMSPGYGNTGSFSNMPGVQPYGGAGRHGNNARFPGDFGIYEDDIFFQE